MDYSNIICCMIKQIIWPRQWKTFNCEVVWSGNDQCKDLSNDHIPPLWERLPYREGCKSWLQNYSRCQKDSCHLCWRMFLNTFWLQTKLGWNKLSWKFPVTFQVSHVVQTSSHIERCQLNKRFAILCYLRCMKFDLYIGLKFTCTIPETKDFFFFLRNDFLQNLHSSLLSNLWGTYVTRNMEEKYRQAAKRN